MLTHGSCRFAVSSLSAAMDEALPLPEGIRRQWTVPIPMALVSGRSSRRTHPRALLARSGVS